MAFNLFDTPDYYTGLLGEEATQKLQNKALGTGLVNAALAFIAQPRNQRYGSALPYLGKALLGGYQAGQDVIQGGLRDYETQQKIAEMKRAQEARKTFDIASKNLYKTIPAQMQTVTTPGGYAPAQTEIQEGQVSPNFGMTRLPDVTTQVQTAPARQQLNQEALQQMMLSGDPRAATYISGLKTLKEFNKPELVTVGAEQGLYDPVTNTWIKQAEFKPESKSDVVKQYEYAVDQGYKGSFENWAKALTPYQLAQLGISQAQLQATLATSQLQQQKTQQEIATARAGTEGAIASFDTALNSIKDLKGHPGLSVAVGASAQPGFQFIAGTDKADFYAKLDTLKAQVFLPQVQQLRGLGALSENEGKKLTDSIGALSTMMSEKEFRKSLNDIEVSLTQAKQRTQRSLQGGGTTGNAPAKTWNSATGKWE